MSTKKKSSSKKKGNNGGLLIVFIVCLALVFVIYFLSRDPAKDDSQRMQTAEDADVMEPDVEDISLHETIIATARQLGVEEKFIRIKEKSDGKYYYIPLNGDELDLPFANALFKGKCESAGAKIISGEETPTGNAQTLYISTPDGATYVLKLFFDTRNRYSARKHQLVVLVDDFGGISGKLLDEWCSNTDYRVTFAIMPDLRHTTTTMEKAAASNHEVIIHMPMEPRSYPRDDPGKTAIYVEMSNSTIEKRVKRWIDDIPLAIGANNHMGSLATSDEEVMRAVLGVLKKHDKIFIDSYTSASSVGYQMAQQMLMHTARRDLFLDDPDISDKTLKERLKKLEYLKTKQNTVIVITHCFDRNRLDYLNRFIKAAEKMGYELTSLSRMFESELPELM
ncbi:MAG: divergent polysaccharide deacetylase family protein [Candidatus Cloacimonetes bacterium]|nr:divergent polysaccharide deacetylase family protein [Candidatus Cloacimonadota bacterium]